MRVAVFVLLSGIALATLGCFGEKKQLPVAETKRQVVSWSVCTIEKDGGGFDVQKLSANTREPIEFRGTINLGSQVSFPIPVIFELKDEAGVVQDSGAQILQSSGDVVVFLSKKFPVGNYQFMIKAQDAGECAVEFEVKK